MIAPHANSREVVGAGGGNSVVAAAATGAGAPPPPWSPDDPEYYNDLPGKVPPDVGPPPVPPLPNYQAPGGPVTGNSSAAGTLKKTSAVACNNDRSGARHAVDLSDNLIDLNADVSSMGRLEGAVAGSATVGLSGGGGGVGAAALSPLFPDHEYVNGIMGSSSDFKNTPAVSKDPFDMRKSLAGGVRLLFSFLFSCLSNLTTRVVSCFSNRSVLGRSSVAAALGFAFA